MIREIQINNKRNGYCEIALYKNNEEKRFRVNRLVANAFIPNPYNYPEVNHKDGNKLNNKEDNLEWVTSKENKEHGWNNNLYKRKIPLEDYKFIYCLNKFENIYQKNIAKYYNVWTTAIERVVRYIRENMNIDEIKQYHKTDKFQEELKHYRENINI